MLCQWNRKSVFMWVQLGFMIHSLNPGFSLLITLRPNVWPKLCLASGILTRPTRQKISPGNSRHRKYCWNMLKLAGSFFDEFDGRCFVLPDINWHPFYSSTSIHPLVTLLTLVTFLLGFTNAGCLACTLPWQRWNSMEFYGSLGECGQQLPNGRRGTKVVGGTPAKCLWSSKYAATWLTTTMMHKITLGTVCLKDEEGKIPNVFLARHHFHWSIPLSFTS